MTEIACDGSDMHKLELSMMETMDLIQMIAGRGAGASQAEAALEMHRLERSVHKQSTIACV